MLINHTNWSLFNKTSPVDPANDLDFESDTSNNKSIFKIDSSELKAKNFLNNFLFENDNEDEFKFGDTFEIDNNDHELFLLNKLREANRPTSTSTSTKLNYFYFNKPKTTTQLKPIVSTKSLLTGSLRILPISSFNLFNSNSSAKSEPQKHSNLIDTGLISPTRLNSNNSIKYFIKNDAIMHLKDKLFPLSSSTTAATMLTTNTTTLLTQTSQLINSTTTTTIATSTLTTASRMIQPQICNCTNGNGYNLLANNKLNTLGLEEYTNIWKLAFFVLSFLICFISLILILTFSIRILM